MKSKVFNVIVKITAPLLPIKLILKKRTNINAIAVENKQITTTINRYEYRNVYHMGWGGGGGKTVYST